jgi:hypothetical protein
LGPQNKPPAGPWGASHRRGVKEDPRSHPRKGRALDLVDDGTRSRGRGRLDVMGFLEHVSTSCGPQSLSKSRMPGLGVCCDPRGPQNKPPAGPWGASHRRGSKRTLGRTPARGVSLTWLTTGPARVGGDGSTLWVFWNKSTLRADLRVFRPLGSIAPSGGQRGPPDTPPPGAWA